MSDSSRQLTVQRTRYPPLVRAISAGLGVLESLGAPFGRLDADDILASARRSTGLSDFGGEQFLAPMRQLLQATSAAPLTPLAHVFMRQTFLKALVQRLRLQDLLKQQPHILDTPLRRPIFVLGFPRSGTTLVQNLLGCDPRRRGLAFWELVTPLPAHADAAEDERRRVRTADRILAASYYMAPEMGQVHEVRSQSLEECWYLLANSFTVLNNDFQAGLPSIGEHLFASDLTWAYQEYRVWLKLLLSQRPAEHLLLKCPEHLWFIEPLLKVFPDACIIWTHRDPVSSIASYSSMMTLPRRMLYGEVDPAALGPFIADRFHIGAKRAMAARERLPPERFFDVDFRALVKDPISVIDAIHDHFDLDQAPDSHARMEEYLSQKRADERGAHVYSASRHGVDSAAVHAQYADYIDRFQIPVKTDHG